MENENFKQYKDICMESFTRHLPVLATLAGRHILISSQCPMCNICPEDIRHMTFKCQRAKLLWQSLGLLSIINQLSRFSWSIGFGGHWRSAQEPKISYYNGDTWLEGVDFDWSLVYVVATEGICGRRICGCSNGNNFLNLVAPLSSLFSFLFPPHRIKPTNEGTRKAGTKLRASSTLRPK